MDDVLKPRIFEPKFSTRSYNEYIKDINFRKQHPELYERAYKLIEESKKRMSEKI